MFIIVKYGDAEEALFNPDCRILHLLENIKERCQCTEEALIDLSDVDGSVRNLVDNQSCNASDFLKGRETFILVRVEKIEGHDRPIYTPLLRDEDFVTSEFLESLSRMPSGLLEVSGRQSKHGRRGSLKMTKMSKPLLTANTGGNMSASSLKTPTGKQRRISHTKRS